MKPIVVYTLSLVAWLAVCALCVLMVITTVHAEPVLSECNSVAAPQYESLTVGKHLVFICADGTGTKLYPDGISCLQSVCNLSAFAASVTRVATSSDYKKAIDAEWSANIKWTCDNPPTEAEAKLCVERKYWIAANWEKWTKDFKPTVWTVKRNGSYPTRPAYSLINGILGTKEVARADVGTVCNILKPTAPATNGDIRAEFGIPGVVTICSNSN